MVAWGRRLGAPEPLCMWTPCWLGEEDPRGQRRLARVASDARCRSVLHGWAHFIPGSMRDRVIFGEPWGAEFATLDAASARERIRRGRELLEDWTGVAVEWFCAPRWRQSAATAIALEGLGFAGYFLKNRIVSLSRAALDVPALFFDVGRRPAVMAVNRWVRTLCRGRLFRGTRPIRLVLHPRDMRTARILDELNAVVEALKAGGWRPTVLHDLVFPDPVEADLHSMAGGESG